MRWVPRYIAGEYSGVNAVAHWQICMFEYGGYLQDHWEVMMVSNTARDQANGRLAEVYRPPFYGLLCFLSSSHVILPKSTRRRNHGNGGQFSHNHMGTELWGPGGAYIAKLH